MSFERIITVGALAILISGCKPNDFDQTFGDTKKRSQSTAVRQAALPLFSLADTNFTKSSLPKEITSLPLFAEDTEDIQCWHVTTNALIFMTGAGFKHWGLLVCKATPRPEDIKAAGDYRELWGDGIFFFE
jgi:hypothetical protein